MSNRYTAKVAEILKLRGWIDEIQAKALRADNARLKSLVSDEIIRGMLTRLQAEHNELRSAYEMETGKPWVSRDNE